MRSLNVTAPIPNYIFRHSREGAVDFAAGCFAQLRDERLVDETFQEQAILLVVKYAHLIPDPMSHKLCFTDMHFRNVLVDDGDVPVVAAFVDIEEIGVGWPMWDFTNWECWGLRFGLDWTRPYILEGYGDIDMDAYKLALMIRLSRPFTFVGSTRTQIIAAVEQQDLSYFHLDKLYQGEQK